MPLKAPIQEHSQYILIGGSRLVYLKDIRFLQKSCGPDFLYCRNALRDAHDKQM
jgi:hypothetical protein